MPSVRQILVPYPGRPGSSVELQALYNSSVSRFQRNAVLRPNTAPGEAAESLQRFLHNNQPLSSPGGSKRFYTRYSQHNRNAMLLSTSNWIKRGRAIPLYVNPRQISWSVPRRETVVKTATGAVRNTWRNRHRGTYLDEYTLNITFQTGNILPSSAYVDITDARNPSLVRVLDALAGSRVPPGLSNFYEFMELVDQPMLMGASENRHIIIMYTRAFPTLRLEGYFLGEPITWEESATGVDGGNQIVWQAAFQVYKSFPRITNYTMMERVYSSWVQTQAANMAVPLEAARANTLPPNPTDPDQSPFTIRASPSNSSGVFQSNIDPF